MVTGISPTAGLGGTSVTIPGSGFSQLVTGVDFGTTAAENFSDVNDSTITAVSPAGMGVVNVFVTTLGGTSATSAADQFSYLPTVTGVSPRSGTIAGGTLVIITGTNLSGATGVMFGDMPVTAGVIFSATEIQVTSPASSVFGPVDVTVTTRAAHRPRRPTINFCTPRSVWAPPGSRISPAFGSPGGGSLVTITGLGFYPTNPRSSSSARRRPRVSPSSIRTTILAVSPAGTGPQDITVTTYGGTSLTSPADVFTYTVDGPLVTGVFRYGYHAQPTYLVINFICARSGPATKLSNYIITGPNGRESKSPRPL